MNKETYLFVKHAYLRGIKFELEHDPSALVHRFLVLISKSFPETNSTSTRVYVLRSVHPFPGAASDSSAHAGAIRSHLLALREEVEIFVQPQVVLSSFIVHVPYLPRLLVTVQIEVEYQVVFAEYLLSFDLGT